MDILGTKNNRRYRKRSKIASIYSRRKKACRQRLSLDDSSSCSSNSSAEIESIDKSPDVTVFDDIELSENAEEFAASLKNCVSYSSVPRASTPISFDDSVEDEDSLSGSNSSTADSDSSCEQLYTGSDISVSQFKRDFSGVVSMYNLTDVASEAILNFISSTLPLPNKCPSIFKINRQLDEDHKQIKTFDIGDGDLFLLSLESQVKKIFESSLNLTDPITTGITGMYYDITDGTMFRKITTQGTKTIYLILNADGVASRYKSKGYQLWPISASIVNLPPMMRKRSENVLLLAVYYGKCKPNPHRLLDLLISEINSCDIMLENTRVNFSFTAFVADFPAKAAFLNMMSFNSRYGCTLCRIEGRYSKEFHKMIFPYAQHPAVLRNAETHARDVMLARESAPVFGVKGRTLLDHLLPVPVGAPLDIMHLIYLNVTKRIIAYAMRHKLMNTEEVSEQMMKIRVPHHFRRKPRSLSELKNWKASEFKHGLLYFFSPVMVSTGASREIVFLLTTLSTATYLLLKDCVTEDDITCAEKLLKAFQLHLCMWFGEESNTITVHALTHLAAQVRMFGPLWATSAAVFENFFYTLVRRIHGTRNEARLLIRNFHRHREAVPRRNERVNQPASSNKMVIDGRKFIVNGNCRSSSRYALASIRGKELFAEVLQMLPRHELVRCHVFKHRYDFCTAAGFELLDIQGPDVLQTLKQKCPIVTLMTGRHMTLKMHSLKSHVIRVTNNGDKAYAVPVLHDFEHE